VCEGGFNRYFSIEKVGLIGRCHIDKVGLIGRCHIRTSSLNYDPVQRCKSRVVEKAMEGEQKVFSDCAADAAVVHKDYLLRPLLHQQLVVDTCVYVCVCICVCV
jgi:hypothetical protein